MHRTQFLLEPSQYRRLKEKASGANMGLGEMIRRAIDRFLGESEKGATFASFCGVMEDSECSSKNYKKFLYSNVRKNLR